MAYLQYGFLEVQKNPHLAGWLNGFLLTLYFPVNVKAVAISLCIWID